MKKYIFGGAGSAALPKGGYLGAKEVETMSKKRQFQRQRKAEEKFKKAAPVKTNPVTVTSAMPLTKQELRIMRNHFMTAGQNDGIARTMFSAACVVMLHWGALNKKETRIAVFLDKLSEYLSKTEYPTPEMKKIEDLMDRQTGIVFVRNEDEVQRHESN